MHHNLPTRLALAVALGVGLLAAGAGSASAATGGTGAFNAAAHINVPPPPFGEPCATYSNYSVALAFDDKSTFTAKSDSNPLSSKYQWGEFGDGTHHPQTSATGSTSCSDTAGQPEGGFTGTLTTSGGAVCTLSDGSYKRVHLDVTYTFNGVTGPSSCPAAPLTVTARLKVLHTFNPPLTIPPGIEITDATACSSPIAPTTCVLDNGSY